MDKNAFIAVGVAGMLAVPLGHAWAQEGITPAPTVTEEQGETTVSPGDDGFDWGWLGLLGLAGLAGLRGRSNGSRDVSRK